MLLGGLFAILKIQSELHECRYGIDLKGICLDEVGSSNEITDSIGNIDSAFALDPTCAGLSLVHWRKTSNTMQEYDKIHGAAWVLSLTYLPINEGVPLWYLSRKRSGEQHFGKGGVEEVVQEICFIVNRKDGAVH